MPKLTLIPEKQTIDIQEGTPLLEAVSNIPASIPYGCRRGSCGTCRVEIMEGAENLNPQTDAEKSFFLQCAHVADNERLACQVTVHGDVTVNY